MKKSIRYSLLLILISILVTTPVLSGLAFGLELKLICTGILLILVPFAVFELIKETKHLKK